MSVLIDHAPDTSHDELKRQLQEAAAGKTRVSGHQEHERAEPNVAGAATTDVSQFVDLEARTDTGGSLRTPPLKLSGAWDKWIGKEHKSGDDEFDENDLTPAIGREYRDVDLSKLLSLPQGSPERNAIVRDLAIIISQRGVVAFRRQDNLVKQQLGQLALDLGTQAGKPENSSLHIHPVQELNEDGSLPLGEISSKPTADGRQISYRKSEDSVIISRSWHTDVSFEPFPAGYTMLRIDVLPQHGGGDTVWSSMYALYELLSVPYRRFLEGLTAYHDAVHFRVQAQRNNFKLRTKPRGHPENSGDTFATSHPVIRTNPVTGRKGVFVNRNFTKRINELTPDESRSVLDYLFRLQAESHDAIVRHRWTKNDLLIWDNRSTQHSATFDLKPGDDRHGDRAVCIMEAPYVDL